MQKCEYAYICIVYILYNKYVFVILTKIKHMIIQMVKRNEKMTLIF